MRARYDFSQAKRNPFARLLKRQVTIRLETATLDYFQALSAELGIPYQTLINLYLRDCATSGRRPRLEWKASSGKS
jgi:uncharacterized protein (DUF4415 family)